jgi:hypothetical protein
MSERDLQAAVERLCRQFALMYYHTHRSEHSTAGWPDLVIVAPARGALFWELKRQGEDPTPAQQQWLTALESLGLEVAVRRPADLLDGTIVTELQQLARRPLREGGADAIARIEMARVAIARASLTRRARRA